MAIPVIVGFDPGLTTACSIVDLHGKVLAMSSQKSATLSNLREYIIKFGKPLIIATDKKSPPPSCKEMAAAFSCKLFTPQKDAEVKHKIGLVKASGGIPKNSHERDALAAALICYRSLSMHFNKIELTLSSLGLEEHSDRIKEMITRKEAKNVTEALEKLFSNEEKIEKKEEKKEIKNAEAEILKGRLFDMQKSRDIFKIYVSKLEDKIKTLELQKTTYQREEMEKNEKMRKTVLMEKEIRNRDIMIQRLQMEVRKLRENQNIIRDMNEKEAELNDLIKKGFLPVISIEKFETEGVADAHKEFSLKDKIVWIKRFKPSRPVLRFLITLGPKAVIGELDENSRKLLKDNDITHVSGIEVMQRTHYAAVDSKLFEEAIDKTEKKDMTDWINRYTKSL